MKQSANIHLTVECGSITARKYLVMILASILATMTEVSHGLPLVFEASIPIIPTNVQNHHLQTAYRTIHDLLTPFSIL